MIPMLTLLVSLTSLPWSLAKNDRQPTVGHAFFISHLSPLISYTPSTPTDDPVSGWNVSLARHSTTNASASVEFAYFGNSFDVLVANYSRLEGIDRSLTTGWHEATITTEQSDDSFMDIRSYIAYTNVPTSTEDTRGTAEHISATNTTDFYKDEAGAWEVMEPPTNESTRTQFSWAWDQPPSYTADYPFNSTVLSTNQVGKPLRFSVPPYTSILQWYGTVGPDQGRYEFRLIPTSEGKIQFQPRSLNQSYTGERSIDAIYETKAIAWLDPRATYDVEIELQEQGKRTDLHGVSFWRFTEVGAEIKDWYTEPSSGLSGGQIAGIVIGSVAGAALIGLAIWWFMRRRSRQQGPAPARKMSDDGQDPLV